MSHLNDASTAAYTLVQKLVAADAEIVRPVVNIIVCFIFDCGNNFINVAQGNPPAVVIQRCLFHQRHAVVTRVAQRSGTASCIHDVINFIPE